MAGYTPDLVVYHEFKLLGAENAKAGIRGIADQARRTTEALRGSTGAMGSASGATNALGASAAASAVQVTVLALAFQRLTRFVWEYIKAGVTLNTHVEQRRLTMLALVKDASTVEKWYQQAYSFAEKTPFTRVHVLDAQKNITAYGIAWNTTLKKLTGDANESARTILELSGDLASAMGREVEDVAITIGKAYSTASAGSLRQLRELGIWIDPEMVKAAHKNTQAMEEYRKTLLKILEIKFGGSMATQMEGFKGITSNIKDQLSYMQFKLLQPMFDNLKARLRDTMILLNQLRLSGQFEKTLSGLAQIFGFWGAASGGFLYTFIKLIGSLGSASPIILGILAALTPVLMAIKIWNAGSRIAQGLQLALANATKGMTAALTQETVSEYAANAARVRKVATTTTERTSIAALTQAIKDLTVATGGNVTVTNAMASAQTRLASATSLVTKELSLQKAHVFGVTSRTRFAGTPTFPRSTAAFDQTRMPGESAKFTATIASTSALSMANARLATTTNLANTSVRVQEMALKSSTVAIVAHTGAMKLGEIATKAMSFAIRGLQIALGVIPAAIALITAIFPELLEQQKDYAELLEDANRRVNDALSRERQRAVTTGEMAKEFKRLYEQQEKSVATEDRLRKLATYLQKEYPELTIDINNMGNAYNSMNDVMQTSINRAEDLSNRLVEVAQANAIIMSQQEEKLAREARERVAPSIMEQAEQDVELWSKFWMERGFSERIARGKALGRVIEQLGAKAKNAEVALKNLRNVDISKIPDEEKMKLGVSPLAADLALDAAKLKSIRITGELQQSYGNAAKSLSHSLLALGNIIDETAPEAPLLAKPGDDEAIDKASEGSKRVETAYEKALEAYKNFATIFEYENKRLPTIIELQDKFNELLKVDPTSGLSSLIVGEEELVSFMSERNQLERELIKLRQDEAKKFAEQHQAKINAYLQERELQDKIAIATGTKTELQINREKQKFVQEQINALNAGEELPAGGLGMGRYGEGMILQEMVKQSLAAGAFESLAAQPAIFDESLKYLESMDAITRNNFLKLAEVSLASEESIQSLNVAITELKENGGDATSIVTLLNGSISAVRGRIADWTAVISQNKTPENMNWNMATPVPGTPGYGDLMLAASKIYLAFAKLGEVIQAQSKQPLGYGGGFGTTPYSAATGLAAMSLSAMPEEQGQSTSMMKGKSDETRVKLVQLKQTKKELREEERNLVQKGILENIDKAQNRLKEYVTAFSDWSMDIFKQIAWEGQSFTKTMGDAFRQLGRDIVNYFIRQIVAAIGEMAILTALNLLSGGISGSVGRAAGAIGKMSIPGFDTGSYERIQVNRPTLAVVGERKSETIMPTTDYLRMGRPDLASPVSTSQIPIALTIDNKTGVDFDFEVYSAHKRAEIKLTRKSGAR